jgi:tRNA(fMet)-specific endonuclease VapC
VKYVLDTNIIAALLNANADVLERMSTIAASDVGIPVVVVSELLYGAHRSARAEENLNRVREYVARFDVLPADTVLFERYAAVRAVLSDRGRPKSDFDLLIACTALVHNATLVTHDDSLKDGAIDGLVVEDWLER